MARQAQMTEPIRHYLATGEYGSPDRAPSLEVFLLAGSILRGAYTEIEALWARHGAGLLKDWVAAHPGCRPFCWWAVVASEPRRVLRGAELRGPGEAHDDDRWWRTRFGLPFFVQARPVGFTGYPVIESEARCLDRLNILPAAERARVPAEDWEPVEINPFHIDAHPAASMRPSEGSPA